MADLKHIIADLVSTQVDLHAQIVARDQKIAGLEKELAALKARDEKVPANGDGDH